MYISKIRVENYKSFLDSGDIYFEPGINIITGQNNGGKSALLKALSSKILNIPHLSFHTKPFTYEMSDHSSHLSIQFTASKKEITDIIFKNPDKRFKLKYRPNVLDEFLIDKFKNNVENLSYFSDLGEVFSCDIFQDKVTSAILLNNKNSTSDGKFMATFIVNNEKKKLEFLNEMRSNDKEDSLLFISEKLRENIYFFEAERLNISKSSFGVNVVLSSNASNLPQVLHNLQTKAKTYQRYHDYVRKVMPQVHQIGVRSKQSGEVEIILWNDINADERDDLAISLSECGTGVSQVLAILYVIVTTNSPQVILIDEPNSFLHPGASRKLIEVLKEFPQHQYIISTHSPEIIAAANPKTIHIVKMENAQSKVDSVDMTNAKNQQLYLAEIGAKLSDVFGADNILWVEGKTEEICFPRIIDKTPGLSLQGTSVLSIKHTGDFDNKKMAKTTFEIYTKLSTGKGLIPPAIGFFFDREDRSKTEMEDLQRQARAASGISDNRDMIVFTKRKMFENYLLDSNAIAEVLKSEGEKSVTEAVVDEWFEQNRWDSSFIKDKTKNIANWIDNVDGANLLDKLFNEVSSTRVKFDKIKHSVALCEWLIEHKIDALDDIVEMLKGFLKKD